MCKDGSECEPLSQQCPVALKGLCCLVASKIQLFWKGTTSLEGEKRDWYWEETV